MKMNWDLLLEIHKNMPRQGSGRDEYTQKAFEMIPQINNPRILDIGCGPGMQTIKLAKMSNGRVIGIDIFDQYLTQLRELIDKEKLHDRVEAVNQSMMDIKYPKETFDIIWAEGSIFIIGFEKGLTDWKKYIKSNGYLAVHEMAWLKNKPPAELTDFFNRVYPSIKTIEENLEIIRKCDYTIIGYFPLPNDAWWEFYYNPLQKRLDKLSIKYKDDPKSMEMINLEKREIQLYKKYNKCYGSVFFIMQKK
jgi:ubiquinone/menaquinone biosynthesis C-methylase UbiE